MLSFRKYLFVIFVLISSISSSLVYSQESISACGHHDYPPWNWEKGGKIVGACAEVTQTLFAKLAVDVDLSYIGPWKRCQREIESGNIDINICSFINPARQRYSKFITTPMGYNENSIFTKKGREFSFSKWSDLNGRVGVMMLGVSIGDKFDRFLEENTKIIRVKNNRQVFGMLARERADFAPYGRYSGAVLLKSIGLEEDFTALKSPVVKGKLYISMSKSSKFLYLLPKIETLMLQPTYDAWVISLLEKYTMIYANDHISSLINNDGAD